MLLELLVADAVGWAHLNTVISPITAKAYTGTYSTSTYEV
jgi:hypothetical protein